MTTVAECVDRVRRDYLLTGLREQRNRLTNSIDADDETLTFDFELGGIQLGARLSVGLEEVGVWSVNGTSKTAVVERGDYGTDAAAHLNGEIVLVNSPFSPARVAASVEDEVAALSSAGLFRMRTIDLAYDSSVMGYNLDATDILSIYEVRRATPGPEEDWPILSAWDLARDLPTDTFASGTALILREGADQGYDIRIRYKAPFGDVSTSLEAGGVPATAIDLIQMGAAIRMIAGREVKRNLTEAQGDTRRAEEVGTGSQLQSVRGLLAVWERRLEEEKRRLLETWPPRKRTVVWD